MNNSNLPFMYISCCCCKATLSLSLSRFVILVPFAMLSFDMFNALFITKLSSFAAAAAANEEKETPNETSLRLQNRNATTRTLHNHINSLCSFFIFGFRVIGNLNCKLLVSVVHFFCSSAVASSCHCHHLLLDVHHHTLN